MKGVFALGRKPRGMTLVEVLVTISILSFLLISVLTLYDTSLKNIRMDETQLEVVHDANVIMAYFSDDIRLAQEVLRNYQTEPAQTVVAALKMKPRTADEAARVIVYALDSKDSRRLIRSVYAGKKSTTIELSKVVQRIEVVPVAERLLKVFVLVADEAAGKTNSVQASSVFTMQ